MFSMVQRQAHTKRRRMFANIYSKSTLHSSAVIRALSQAIFIDRLLPIIDSAAKEGTPINMLDYCSAMYSDFTTAFVFGLQGGSNFVQDDRRRARWVLAKRIMLETPAWAISLPAFITSFLTRLGINLETPQTNPGAEEIKEMYLNMLRTAETVSDASQISQVDDKNEKWTEPVVYKHVLSQLRSSAEKPPTYPLPESHLRLVIASELMDHLVAGTETSGWTLAYAMQELSQRPNLQSSLRGELHSLSPPILYPTKPSNNNDSTSIETLPTPRAIDALPTLDAIILETLRLHAPVSGSQPRVTPSNNPRSRILDYPNLPPGIRVSAQAYCLHRNPEVFPDQERWKPERWLEASPEKRAEMLRWFWAFGSGANMCLGNHLAMLGE
jgi:cytochrome P450